MVELFFDVDKDDPDLGGAVNALERWGNRLALELDVINEKLRDMLLYMLEQLTPVNEAPADYTSEPRGLTRMSWTVLVTGPGEFFITNSNEPVISYLTLGTGPHWVAPRWAKVLHWIDPVTGQDRFSTGHEVSGIVGLDIEETALDWLDPYIDGFLDAALDAADREVGFE